MRRLLVRSCSAVFLSVAVTACSSQTGSSALPIQATRLSQPSAGYETIRSFKGGTFGIGPVGRLALVHGSLYGVTDSGGAPLSGNLCCGTVFRAQKSGRGKLLYRFYGSGGVEPSSVMALGGALYVTTALGGVRGSYGMGYGTVFSFSVSGAGRLLYRFGGSPDGAVPIGTLSAVNGVFYGTTEEGGAHGAGTVYEISTSGVESVLYSFKGGLDGSSPRAGLTYFNGAGERRSLRHHVLGRRERFGNDLQAVAVAPPQSVQDTVYRTF